MVTTETKRRYMSSYEARCAAYWLYYDRHVQYKYVASHVVGRGLNSHRAGFDWFRRYVDESQKELQALSSKRWKDQHRVENRVRDVEFKRHRKTPYYKALKSEVGDLRVLGTG